MEFLKKSQYAPFLDEYFNGSPSFKALKGGLLNQNILVTHKNNKYVFKIYRLEIDLLRLQEIHRVMNFVKDRQIPAPEPIFSGVLHQYAIGLYPFIDGVHPPKFKNNKARILKMGEMLGRLNTVLKKYPYKGPVKSYHDLARWNQKTFLEEIQKLRKSITGKKQYNFINPVLDEYQDIVERQKWSINGFEELPIQLCHNDYHGDNLLMRGNRVIAIFDWEKTGQEWPCFELMRSIIFNCRKSAAHLDWELIKAYISGFKNYATLIEKEKILAFECGYRSYLFGLWAVKQYLNGQKNLRGNILRRYKMVKELTKNKTQYAERMYQLLK